MNTNDIQFQNNAHPKTSPIDCDGMLVTNEQCRVLPIDLVYIIIVMKYNFIKELVKGTQIDPNGTKAHTKKQLSVI